MGLGKNKESKIAIVIMGGGARAAYQVGVLRAIADFLPKNEPCPFKIICGTSAGAINAAALACFASNFRLAVVRTASVWRNFQVHQVFRSDFVGLVKTLSKWFAALVIGGFGKGRSLYLLDRKPLKRLLKRYINVDEIQRAIDNGYLHAVSITASGYTTGQSVTFYQGHEDIEGWSRVRRIGCRGNITIDHLMASSAIPILFEPIKLNREYFGDGSMRQMAPLSAALHLGADRVFVIGNRDEDEGTQREQTVDTPSLAHIAAHVLNSIFLDSLEADFERLNRINKTVGIIPDRKLRAEGVSLHQVATLQISPSDDVGEMAQQHLSGLPWPVKILLKGMGALKKEGSSLASYLLFEKGYTRALIELGYKDGMRKKDEIISFLNGD